MKAKVTRARTRDLEELQEAEGSVFSASRGTEALGWVRNTTAPSFVRSLTMALLGKEVAE